MKIRFLNGPNKDQEFAVQKGLILSRKSEEEGEVPIGDPKASSPHAEIVQKKGVFYLQDMDSKNGTYLKGKINDFFALKAGLKFQIGETWFQVISPPPPPPAWDKIVAKELKTISPKDRPQSVTPLKHPLTLKFRSGVQKGDIWHIHYGPRSAGSASLDLPILEPDAPDLCFHLLPEKTSVLFKTQYPEKVLLNKKHTSRKKLSPGDSISFGGASIEVHYKKKPRPKTIIKKPIVKKTSTKKDQAKSREKTQVQKKTKQKPRPKTIIKKPIVKKTSTKKDQAKSREKKRQAKKVSKKGQ